MTRVELSNVVRPHWSPALNVYRGDRFVLVCADLAGVDGAALEIHAEPRRLVIRGRREPPELPSRDRPTRVLAMEIEHGLFEREVVFAEDIDARRVTAEQRGGLLWVHLPLPAKT